MRKISIKLILKSLAIGFLVAISAYFCVLNYAMQYAPAEGFVFERLPVKTGIYSYPRQYGKSALSYLDEKIIKCKNFSFYQFSHKDCGFKNILNDKKIEVTEITFNTFLGDATAVIKIVSSNNIYYEIDDAQIIELWLKSTENEATLMAYIVFILISGVLLYLKIKSFGEKQ